jgi:HEAT repeat protein
VLRKALEPVRAALEDPSAEIKDAALRGLADWPSSAAAPDLLKLAQAPKKDARSILALRGYVRLAGLVAGRSAPEGVKMYQEAIEVAKRPDEKKQILSGLAGVKSLDALKLAEPCLKDAPVKAEAIEAVITIAGNLRGAHPDESKAALEEVLSLTQDKRIRDRVGDLLQGKRPGKRRK